jgi:membrane protease YdiL (CAAX protease family)
MNCVDQISLRREPEQPLPQPRPEPRGSSGSQSKRSALIELSVGYGLILLVLWTPQPWQRWLSWAAIVWIVAVTSRSFESWREWGLTAAGLRRSLWVVGLALAMAASAAFFAARLHTLHRVHGLTFFVRSFWGYSIWAFVQQCLLQGFVLLRLRRVLPGKKAAAVAALLFAVAHLPSPILTIATLVWGFAACLLFLRYRNLYTLGIAHAIFGICIAMTVPGRVDHNMRVGRGYLAYRPHLHRSHNPQSVSTVACVIAEAPTRRS